jgi:hypothetical protein
MTKGPRGGPKVTIKVHIPIFCARSFLKKVSTTTPLPIALAGLIKKDTRHRHKAIVPYEWLNAQPTLRTTEQRVEMSHTGRRPYLFEMGFQNSGANPSITIVILVRYETFWSEHPRSLLISSKAGMIPADVKVAMQAWNATWTRFAFFYISQLDQV